MRTLGNEEIWILRGSCWCVLMLLSTDAAGATLPGPELSTGSVLRYVCMSVLNTNTFGGSGGSKKESVILMLP